MTSAALVVAYARAEARAAEVAAAEGVAADAGLAAEPRTADANCVMTEHDTAHLVVASPRPAGRPVGMLSSLDIAIALNGT